MRIPSDGLWRNHDFLKLWSAQSVSVIGTLLGALQFTAILNLDAGPRRMSILTAASVTPALVLGILAGAWVDRLRRRPILVAATWVGWLCWRRFPSFGASTPCGLSSFLAWRSSTAR
ncbi:MAG: MFS transporter [SAR202 cluster bacterium]|jgi:MFS family permease|nr:MFS transporter [SAR202 cluster bacterium]|tara:strand:- start:791 stop:1141 length:351 start_codon:yes stop_codon:yes gene_type:complete